MENVNLNAGGFIGAVLVGGIAGAILFSTMATDRATKLSVGALVAGAISGNMAWSYIFPPPIDQTSAGEKENKRSKG